MRCLLLILLDAREFKRKRMHVPMPARRGERARCSRRARGSRRRRRRAAAACDVGELAALIEQRETVTTNTCLTGRVVTVFDSIKRIFASKERGILRIVVEAVIVI